MDKVYDFSWLVSEIDSSMILKLMKDDESLGVYQVSDILDASLEKVKVKFANANDLINFINHSVVRFRGNNDDYSILDIPFRKIWLLYLNSNSINKNDKRKVNLSKLDAFLVCNGDLVKDECYIYPYKVNKESDELRKVMKIAFNFGYLGMQEKFDTLAKVNLINYHMTNSVSKKRA